VIYLGLPSPVAELAATVGGYREGYLPATWKRSFEKSDGSRECDLAAFAASKSF